MKIDEQLQKNLIADVENICELNLSNETKIALMRCFEITIGIHYLKPVEIPEIDNDTILALPLDVPSDEEIEKKAMNHNRTDNYTTIDYYSTGIIVGSKWMRDEIINRNRT